jgi:hypothetical protein
LALKADCLAQLHDNIYAKKIQRESFYNKVLFLANKRLHEPIEQWKMATIELKMEQTATKFFEERSAQYIKRLAWDSLKIRTVHS